MEWPDAIRAFLCDHKLIKLLRMSNMDHVAIMSAKSGYIERILEGKKKIETRWYLSKRAPWQKINPNDVIYFKYAGGEIVAKAEVEKVLQFTQNKFVQDLFSDIETKNFITVLEDHADDIYVQNMDAFRDYVKDKNYAILVFLKNPQKLEQSFQIDKTGFGCSCAWICVEDIKQIKS